MNPRSKSSFVGKYRKSVRAETPAAAAISSTVTSLKPSLAKSSQAICSYLASSMLRRRVQPDSSGSVTSKILAHEARASPLSGYRVSSMQPAMGPPPLETTATSRLCTWRSPA